MSISETSHESSFLGKSLSIRRGELNTKPIPDTDGITANAITGLKLFNFSTETIIIHTRMGTAVVLEPLIRNINEGVVVFRNYGMTFDKSIPTSIGGRQANNTGLPGNCASVYEFKRGNYTERVSGRSSIYPTIRLDVTLSGDNANNAIITKLNSYFNNTVNDTATHAVDEVLKISDLSKDRGIYLPDSDVVVSLGPEINPNISHPYFSVSNIENYKNMMNEYATATSYNPSIKLVDNNGELGGKYAVFHDQLIYLDPVRDPSLEDGLYLFGLRGNSSENRLGCYDSVYYNPVEMYSDENILRVYDSQRQAKEAIYENGDSDILNTERTRAYELEITNLKQHHTKETISLKRSIDERSAELDRIRHDEILLENETKGKLAMVEAELLSVKHEYAKDAMAMKSILDINKHRTDSAKVELESWKVAVGAVGLGVIIMKLFSDTSK